MLIPISPETLAQLKQGSSVGIKEVPGVQFIITRLGTATMDELRPHPAQSEFFNQPRRQWKFT